MIKLFTTLSQGVEGAPLIAIAASFAWGVLSVLLSPCHLSSIPLIVGYVSNPGKTSTRRAFLLSTLFSLGILVSIACIGAITAAAGRILGDIGRFGNYFVAIIFLFFGLNLLGIISLPGGGSRWIKMKNDRLLPIFSLGLIFGLALGPCTFAFMAPMLGVVFRFTSTNLLYGLLLLSAFSFGHCTVIITAGTSSQWVQHYLNWNEKSKGTNILKKACGILVLLGGIYLIYCTI